MDLGNDFYLVHFNLDANYHKILHNGPWFIDQHFLSIRKWEPKFNAHKADCLETAIRARFRGLPTEVYDKKTLEHMGSKIGMTLKIDAHTNHSLRGQLSRICVQVQVNKPLKNLVHVGNHAQPVIYEGLNQICFLCGKLGHLNNVCPDYAKQPPNPIPIVDHSRPPTLTNLPNSHLPTQNIPLKSHLPTKIINPDFSKHGPWMVVQ